MRTDFERTTVDQTDRKLLTLLQQDATRPYADLGQAVGLSGAAAHDRVRKLRESGVIRRTVVDVDPAALGLGVLAFVTIEADAWMGGDDTARALEAVPQVEEAHIVAGSGTVMLKVRTSTTADLQAVMRRLFEVPGVRGTDTTIVLDTVFERQVTELGPT